MLLELCALIVCKQSNPIPPSQEQEQVQSAPKHIPDHHVREAVNPRTGRRERVFVDLESVYPDYRNPAHEVSFEELRAMKRGWMSTNWRSHKEPLQQISGNAGGAERHSAKLDGSISENDLPEQFDEKLTINGQPSRTQQQDTTHESKSGKSRRFKVQGETQTSKSLLLLLSRFVPLPFVQLRATIEFRQNTKRGRQNVRDEKSVQADDFINSQNEVRLANELKSPAEEYKGADNDHAHSRCNR